MSTDKSAISVENVTLAFGAYVVQRDVSFSIMRGEIFVIMGDSGSGKSTMLRSMIELCPLPEAASLMETKHYGPSMKTAERKSNVASGFFSKAVRCGAR